MPTTLSSKIALIRRKEIGVQAAKGLALIAALLIAGFALTTALDWWIELPRLIRALLLTIELAGVAFLAWRYFLHPILFGPDDDEIALRVERGDTRFRGRLISAVQLSRQEQISAGTSPTLVRALIIQTESMAAAVDFGRFVPTRGLLRAAIIACVLIMLGAGGYLWARPASDDLLLRAVLLNVPVPRKTHVIDLTGDIKVARGDPVTITARADGVQPLTGRLFINYPTTSLEYDMHSSPDENTEFSCKIDNVRQSFTYRIWLNDGHGADHTVTAVARPDVEQLICIPRYPAYTGLQDAPLKTGDITMLNGSGLDLIVIPDKNLSPTDPTNQIEFVGAKQTDPLQILPAGSPQATTELTIAATSLAELSHLDPQSLAGQTFIQNLEHTYAARSIAIGGTGPDTPLPLTTTGFTIHLVDEDGFASADSVVHPINLFPTRPPRVQIINRPKEEELVTRAARVNVAYQAIDDFGLSHLTLNYKIEGGGNGQLDLPLPQSTRFVSDTYQWDLSTIPSNILPNQILPEENAQPAGDEANAVPAATPQQNVIEFWLTVDNTNNVTSPNKLFDEAASDIYQLHVVTPEEKEKDLQSQTSRIPGQIDPLVHQQTEVSNKIGDLVIHNGEAPTTQP